MQSGNEVRILATANSWKEIEKMIQVKINQAMNTTVASGVKEIESENANEFVYNSYDPTVYERRGNDGGLSDVRNMNHVVDTSGNSTTLEVTNDTMSNPDFLPWQDTPHKIAQEVEFGFGYNYGNGNEPYAQERPFQRETINELATGKAKKLLQKGLKELGIDSF